VSDVVTPPADISTARPLHVHVVGNSASYLVEPQHGPRTGGGNYGEQLVELLAAEGVPTRTTHAGRWFGQVQEFIGRYEADIRDPFPDVLVLHFGMAEAQTNLLPTAVVRHFGTWHRGSHPVAVAYRGRVAPRLWKAARAYQRWAGSHDDGRTHRLSPQRFTRDMTRLVELIRKDVAPLVLLLDLDPITGRVEYWLPGQSARRDHYQKLLFEIAGQFDDAVRVVEASKTITDVDTQVPDGLHRTAAAHRLTAELLRDEILAWLGKDAA
jgi:lysophospholipase L1-like esterase